MEGYRKCCLGEGIDKESMVDGRRGRRKIWFNGSADGACDVLNKL